ncbi:MAG: DnaJ C-terminal domain-containing protein [Gammaproteobacteria bacterium]
MEFKDYYKIMGVGRDASQDEIKRSYRKLARKYHPDVSKEADAEARFKEIGEAYEVLKDPEKRAAYDQLGMNWKGGQDFRPPPDWDAGFEFRGADTGGVDPAEFSDFFESLFGRDFRTSTGRGGGQRFHTRGEDHHAKVLIDIEDAFKGARKTITLRSPQVDAGGHVQLRERSLNVQIPKGVKQGQKIRLAGQGASGVGGGKAGDLYLEIEFEPHPVFRVYQRDIHLDLPVAPWEAALGARVKVPTPSGSVELTIPPNTKSGSKLRLKGRGIPGNPAGDIFVIPQIVLPPANDDKSRDMYRQMKDQLDFNPRSHLGV